MGTTVDRFGRIVIPKEVRDELGLETGTEITIEPRNGMAILAVREEEPRVQVKEGILVYTGETAGDLLGAVQTQRRDRVKRLGVFRRKR